MPSNTVLNLSSSLPYQLGFCQVEVCSNLLSEIVKKNGSFVMAATLLICKLSENKSMIWKVQESVYVVSLTLENIHLLVRTSELKIEIFKRVTLSQSVQNGGFQTFFDFAKNKKD